MIKMTNLAPFNTAKATPAQIDAIRSFTGEGYIGAGHTIARIYDGEARDNFTREAEFQMATLLKNHSPNYTGAMYRGLYNFNVLEENDDEFDIRGFDATVGDIIEFDTLASWTKKRDVAQEFADGKHPADEGGVPTTILFIKNGAGFDIAQHARIPSEAEIITPPHTKLRVVSIEDRGCEEYFVEVEIVI